MPPYVGRGLASAMGEESTWGSTEPTNIWFELISESMQMTVTKVPRPVLVGGASSRNRRAHYIERIDAGGDIEALVTYEGLGVLLKHALGATPSTTGPTDGLYAHTQGMSTSPPVGLTIAINRGDGTGEVFAGCKISKMTLKCEAGGLFRVSLGIIAKSSGGRVSAAATDWTTSRDLTVVSHEGGVVVFNSVNYTWRNITITVDNKLARRLLNGSAYTAEPIPGDFTDVQLSMEREWSSDTLYAAYLADTSADLSVVFTAASGGRAINLALNNCYIETYSSPVSSAGIVPETATFRAQADGTGEGISIVTTNTQSSATAR